LRKREAGDGELSDAEHANPELRDADDAAAELANGDDAARHNGCSIGPELERNVQEGQPPYGELGFVLVAPPIPRIARRIWRSTARAGECLFGNLVATLATGLHGKGPRRYQARACSHYSRTVGEVREVDGGHEHDIGAVRSKATASILMRTI